MTWLIVGAIMAYNIKTAVRIRNKYFTGPDWDQIKEKGHA